MIDQDRCKGCDHLMSDHFRGPDPDCKGPLTPDRKPGRAP